jgi:transglutaminase-like putative cysteine protease
MPVASPVRIVDVRTIDLEQTVTLRDIPQDARTVRLWVPVPGDRAWQRVLDLRVTSAPPGWRLVRQAEGRGDFVFVEAKGPFAGDVSVTVQCRVRREGVLCALESAAGPVQTEVFAAELDTRAPLMEVDARIEAMANKACGEEPDIARQARLLMRCVAEAADHYSKDPSKPTCGRGAAEDCLAHGGGCCTDLHSLFIALARARGIPARMQYGYRVLDARAGTTYDPGYRCWVEVFLPGTGWVPTDVVAADGVTDPALPAFGTLSATRVWLWEGRSFALAPAAVAERVDTMICGWAEVDGVPVDVLPSADGKPSRLGRTVRFTVVDRARAMNAPPLPE